MAVVDVLNKAGERVSQVEIAEGIFNVPVKPSILHEVVRMQLAKRRSGNASVKRRSDVKGSRRKLFRQKGTGRARRGDIKAPGLRGGGVAFGPSHRSYAFSVPKKVRRLALKMALSSKFQDDQMTVIDNFDLEKIKTKEFVDTLKNLSLSKALIVIDEKNEHLELSSRNVPDVKVLRSEGLNVYDILKFENLIFLEPALKAIEGRLLS